MSRTSRLICLIVFVLTPTLRAAGPILPPEEGLPVIDWKNAGQYMDKQVVVQGKILLTRNIGKYCFLNFDRAKTFTALVREMNYKYFPTPPERMYDQKLVSIRGFITDYNGKPQIEIGRPEQVTILEKPLPLSSPPAPKEHPFDGTVTVAAFNSLNFFDEYDDPYTNDEGTEPKPRVQLEALAKRIHELNADVLAMEEVENRGYLQRFVTAMLPDMGYNEVVLFEGNDTRGIDCALLSRLPVGPVTSHRHEKFSDGSGGTTHFQRDLLQVQIEPPGVKPFTVFVVHFKSKRGSAASGNKIRAAECTQVRKVLKGMLDQNANARYILCGDFNDTWDSKPLKALRGEDDVLKNFLSDVPPKTPTFNTGDHLDMIDYILASPAMSKCYVPKSYRIIPGSIESGGSDHNPVSAKFSLKGAE